MDVSRYAANFQSEHIAGSSNSLCAESTRFASGTGDKVTQEPTFETFFLNKEFSPHFVYFCLNQISADSGITMRYDEILSRSIRIAQNLRARGYQKGQVFGYVAQNSQNAAPIVFAS